MQTAADKNENHDPGTSPNMARGRDSASNASVANAGQLEKLPFQLQSGEEIIRELKPQFKGFMLTRVLGSYIFLVALSAIIIVAGIMINRIPIGLLLGLAAIPLIILIISIGPAISYGKSWYWITTRRVIGKRGFVGYTIDSIPLENVTDVVLARTVLDRFLGLSSLIIVPMGGGTRSEGDIHKWGAQSPNFFPALPQKLARELQRTLFNLRDELKKPQGAQTSASAYPPASSEVAQPRSDQPRSTK